MCSYPPGPCNVSVGAQLKDRLRGAGLAQEAQLSWPPLLFKLAVSNVTPPSFPFLLSLHLDHHDNQKEHQQTLSPAPQQWTRSPNLETTASERHLLSQSSSFGQSRTATLHKPISTLSGLFRLFIGNSTSVRLGPIVRKIQLPARSPSHGLKPIYPSSSCPPGPTSLTFSCTWHRAYRSCQSSTPRFLFQNGFSLGQQDRSPPGWC